MAQEKKRRLRRRWIVLAIILLLIAALVLPPLVNLNRYRREIAASISGSIGRPVSMSSVSFQLLPLPALSLSNFVVAEPPGFGAEPMLQADSVTAYPRISSLWRGRLEISRIDFDHASLNLVRDPDGAWNFASVLVRAAETPQAPTGQVRPGRVLRFPYIEVSHSRVNFKSGNEKKPFSFMDSDASVWLENSGSWGVHFRAHPVRTDIALDPGDTGTIQIDGSMQRASILDQMPLDLRVTWSNAQMGQFSRILLGRDAGWRGSLNLRGRIRGSAGLAHLKTTITIDGLHRMEFMPDQPLTLRTRCEAVYRKGPATIDDISCRSRAGTGTLHLTGAIAHINSRPQPDLALSIKNIPASTLLQALKEVRTDVNDGVRAEGELQGKITYVSTPTPKLAGTLEMRSLAIRTPGNPNPFQPGPVRFLFESGSGNPFSKSRPEAAQPALLLEPVELPMGRKTPLTIDGRFTPAGFNLHLSGEGSLARFRRLDTILAWSGTSPTRSSRAALGVRGDASLDVNLSGPWVLPFTAPGTPAEPFTATGSVTVDNADLVTSYLPQPLTILSAQALLGPKSITWTNAAIEYDGMTAKGTLEYPSLCASNQPCAAHFHLNAKTIDLAKVQSALLASAGGDLFRQILNRIDGSPRVWPTLSGSFAVKALSAGPLVVHGATGAIKISDRSLHIDSLNGRFLGGAMHLTGNLDLSGNRPQYTLTAQLEGASANALAALFEEKWGGGRLNLAGQWKMSGWSTRQLVDSADGKLHWDWIRNLAEERTSLHNFEFHDWSGEAAFKNRFLKIIHSRLDRSEKTIPLTGAISFDRDLNLTHASGANAITITGTLESPKVTRTTAENQAQKHP